MSSDLCCMNCKAPVETDKVKMFAEVFVCPNCYDQAVHFYGRLEKELKHLLLISKESIRISLVTGKFTFPEGPRGEASKKEVLEQVLLLEEAREQYEKDRKR